MATTCPSGGTLDIFIDPHLPRPLLAVIGGSPAARTLIELGRVLGFRTCAVHPGAHAADFPGADRVVDSLDLSSLAHEKDCWVVVATMGHYDDDALAAALTPDGRGHRAGGERAPLRRRGGHAPRARRVRCAAGPGACPGRRTACRGAGGDRAPRARGGRRAPPRAHDREPCCPRLPRSPGSQSTRCAA